jgi:hypothetical protein
MVDKLCSVSVDELRHNSVDADAGEIDIYTFNLSKQIADDLIGSQDDSVIEVFNQEDELISQFFDVLTHELPDNFDDMTVGQVMALAKSAFKFNHMVVDKVAEYNR